jgi:uncharacterized protein (UPF0335 family)
MKLDNESRINLLEDKIEQLTQRINHLEDEREELFTIVKEVMALRGAVTEMQEMHEAPAMKFTHYTGKRWWK